MKTLDEVIKAFEWCCNDDNDDCDGCPYETGEATDCHVRNIDALYYLREYWEILNTRLYIPDGYKTVRLGDKNRENS